MLVKAIQGDDTLYLVQKAWRYEPTDGELEGWFEELGSFIVCGKVKGPVIIPGMWEPLNGP